MRRTIQFALLIFVFFVSKEVLAFTKPTNFALTQAVPQEVSRIEGVAPLSVFFHRWV